MGATHQLQLLVPTLQSRHRSLGESGQRGEDLGIKVKVSVDGGETFGPVVDMSLAQGSLAEDDEFAFESQIVTHPDGLEFYGTWAQSDGVTSKAMFVTAETTVDDL